MLGYDAIVYCLDSDQLSLMYFSFLGIVSLKQYVMRSFCVLVIVEY